MSSSPLSPSSPRTFLQQPSETIQSLTNDKNTTIDPTKFLKHYGKIARYLLYYFIHIIGFFMMQTNASTEFIGIIFTMVINWITHLHIIFDLGVNMELDDPIIVILFLFIIILVVANILMIISLYRIRYKYLPVTNNEQKLNQLYLDDYVRSKLNIYKRDFQCCIIFIGLLFFLFLMNLYKKKNNVVQPFFDFDILLNILYQKTDHYFDGFMTIIKIVMIVSTFIMLIQMINIGYVLSKRQFLSPTTINSSNSADTEDAAKVKSSISTSNKTMDKITIPLQTAYNNLNLNYFMNSTHSKPI